MLAAIVLTTLSHHALLVNAWTNMHRPSLSRSTSIHMSSSSGGTQQTRSKVLIVGGGFGGLTCQKELQTAMPNADITIVDPNERFTFLPLLYEYLGGYADLDEIAPTYEFLLSSSQAQTFKAPSNDVSTTRMKRASALKVDPENKTLTVQNVQSGDKESLSFDALVVSCGMAPSKPKENRPSMPSSAFSFATLNDAVRLKRRLGLISTMNTASSIVVVGGGYVGSELACTLAKTLPSDTTQVTILHRDPTGVCTGAEDYNRESAQERLTDLGVHVQLGATVTNVDSKTSENGQSYDDVHYSTVSGNEGSIRADVLIWTVAGASRKPRDVIEGLPMDDRGRVIVSPTCQVEGLENIYAIGDGAVVEAGTSSSSPYPATAQVAMQQASVAASNIQLDLEKNDSLPRKQFSYQSLGEMLSLGGDEDASIASLNGLFTLNGPLASTARRLVYAARMPTPKQAVRSGAGYVFGGLTRGVETVLGLGKDAVDNLAR